MNKKVFAFLAFVLSASLVIAACSDSYNGCYYEVTWGTCPREQMEPIWQNPDLSYAETKAALTAQSGDTVNCKEDLKERSFLNCLEDDVHLQDWMVESLVATLNTRPDATQSYYRSTNPDTCYWVYVKKR